MAHPHLRSAGPLLAKLCRRLTELIWRTTPFQFVDARVENHERLYDILCEIFRGRTLEEWKQCLDAAGCRGPNPESVEVINDPQARANDFFISYDHPTYGPIEVVAPRSSEHHPGDDEDASARVRPAHRGDLAGAWLQLGKKSAASRTGG